jgi:MoaA/NifB/PqqE/SkfB family radical SAM enzyme
VVQVVRNIGAGVGSDIFPLQGDMVEQFKFLINSVPSYLVFWVTRNCNARCGFCFNLEQNPGKSRDLAVDEIEETARRYGHLKYLTLGGGEPTLRTDLHSIADCFVRHAGLQVLTVVTNGILWESALEQIRRILESFPRLGVNVGVSIDYLGERHDESRGVPGCYESCIRLISGLKRLIGRHRNLMVSAVGTLTRDNQDSILETAGKMVGTYGICYSVNLVRGNIPNNELKDVRADVYRTVVSEVFKLNRKTMRWNFPLAPFRYALDEMAAESVYKCLKTGSSGSVCRAGRKGILLESGGELRLCETLPDSLGNLRDHGFDIPAMLRRPEAREIISRVKLSRCRCTWECILRANAAYDITKYPDLFLRGMANAGAMVWH